MAHMPVLKEPNAVLRQTAKPVDPKEIGTDRVQRLIDDMIQTMHVSNGVGIAGPQVAASERVIIAELGQGPEAFINPEIVGRSFRKVNSEEGCLSVPGVYGIVKRHKGVTVKAYNRAGEVVTRKTTGLPAIIFQHEIDHLDGILFIDKVERYTSELGPGGMAV